MSFIPFSQKKYVPLGPKSAEIISKIDKFSAQNYTPYPFVVSKTQGAFFIDPDGNKALDFLSGYSAVLFHREESMVKSLISELENGSGLTSRAVYSESYAEFVELLAQVTGFKRTLPKSDGGSATDAAIKGLLIHAGIRGIKSPNIILTGDYFHGRTVSFAANANFDPEQKAGIPITMPWVRVVDNNLESIKAAIDENTIGIFIEPHKGEGGPLFSDPQYFLDLRELTNSKNIFLGYDEIQTGLGRCGYIMAWQEAGDVARPDFVTLGKALGGGGLIPVATVTGTEEFMKAYSTGVDGSTYGGYPLASRAGIAALKYIVKNDIPTKAIELGNYFVKKLCEENLDNINVENRGALIRVEIKNAPLLHGLPTAKYAMLEMLLGENRCPRVFMKYGHGDPKTGIAYTRIAPPIGAMTHDLIDEAVEKTIAPVLRLASEK